MSPGTIESATVRKQVANCATSVGTFGAGSHFMALPPFADLYYGAEKLRSMKDEELARLRLRRQHLVGTPLATPEAVVGWLGAVQAQEFGVAKWSIAQRSRGRVTSADLDRALGEGRILRTHAMRATWHFVLPADLRWLLMLIGPRVRARMASYCWQNGLTDAVFARSSAVLRE